MRGERGFTLIELVMTIVILGSVAALMANSFLGAVDMVRTETALSDECVEVRRLTGTLSSELRGASGRSAFQVWGPTDCAFLTSRGDSIRFTWSGAPGAPLVAQYNAAVDTLSRAVDSLAFAFLDPVGSPATADTNIYNVSLYVRLNHGGAPLAQAMYVHVRN